MKTKYLMALLALLTSAAGLHAQSLSTLISTTNGLNGPYSVAVDSQNNYYISDSGNNRILVYTPSGTLTNLAGANPAGGASNGPGFFATFQDPAGIVFARGGLAVADSLNQTIRFINSSAIVSTLAGITGQYGIADGPGTSATFDYPSGLAADAAGNLYVTDLLTGRLRQVNLTNGVTTLATGFYRPQGVAVDPAGNIYVADTGNNSIKKISGGTVTLIAGSGSRTQYGLLNSLVGTAALFDKPAGLLWVPGTGLIVSDTGNGVLRLVTTNAVIGGYKVTTYFANSSLAAPAGLAADIYGNIVVTDGINNSVDSVVLNATQATPINAPSIGTVVLNQTANGPSTQLTAVTSQIFNDDVVVAILPQSTGVETFYTLGSSSILSSSPSSGTTPVVYADGQSFLPLSIFNAASAGPIVNVFAISIAPGTGRQPSPIVSATFTYQAANPSINGTDPSNFSVSEQTPGTVLTYTTDGSNPTNSPTSQVYTPGQSLNILNGTNDVLFQVVATRQGFLPSTIASETFHYANVQTSLIGLNHNFVAGPGASIMLPIKVKMASTNTLQSLQYVVQITANGTAPLIPTQLKHVPITTNDFVFTPTVATNLPQVSVFTNGSATSISITYAGGGTGFSVAGAATVAYVSVPIPANASYGQTYTVTIIAPSGTSDALQNTIFLSPFPPATITVQPIGYTVGDTAPGTFYNAKDFGNGLIDNADVNNALYASLGLRLPPNFTDAFDAMDAFPVDQPGVPGGDGSIRFLDWQVILNRALGVDTNNFVRGWVSNPGGTPTRTNAQVFVAVAQSVEPGNGPARGILSLHKAEGILPGTATNKVYQPNAPGAVWLRQGAFGATAPSVVQPGQTYTVPIWVKLMPGCSLSGLQFKAALIASTSAANPVAAGPALTFTLAAGLPAPLTILSNVVAEAWPLGSFNPPLTGSNVLGSLSFTVPNNATGLLTLVFVGEDGAPPEPTSTALWTQYDFEHFISVMGVGAPPPTLPSVTSDTWKIHFFGTNYANSAVSSDMADADGDGVPNWIEYLAGTDPTNPNSFLKVSGSLPAAATNGGVVVSFLTAPGKTYQIQATPQLGGAWTTISGLILGDGTVQQYTDTDPTHASGNWFYRAVVVVQ